jgi:signal transduction histidine kinase
MRICALSKDPDLQQLCREVLEQHSDDGFSLVESAPGEKLPHADLYILDIRAAHELPDNLSGELFHKSIFVVGRSEMDSLRSTVQHLPLTVLLKPVNRARLEIAFEQALTRTENGCPQVLRTDRDNLLQFLLQANLKLQEYDQDRTNFIGRAVHEFRAPLTSIGGYCGMLLTGNLGNLTADQREAVDRMKHSVARLSRLTTSLFELSVGQRTDRSPNLQKGDLPECVERALQVAGPLCQDRRISLDWQFRKPEADLYFVPDQIEQVMINLLENSCKFTPRGGYIQIRAYPYFWERRLSRGWSPAGIDRRRTPSRNCNSFRLEIRDNGPGILPEHVDSVFEEYTSYAGGEDRSGAGLGLAICKVILRSHGGRIWAEASATGANFSFVLPYGAPTQPCQAAAVNARLAAAEAKPVFPLM